MMKSEDVIQDIVDKKANVFGLTEEYTATRGVTESMIYAYKEWVDITPVHDNYPVAKIHSTGSIYIEFNDIGGLMIFDTAKDFSKHISYLHFIRAVRDSIVRETDRE